MRTKLHSADAIAVDKQKPVWLRIPTAVSLFGLGRTKIYELIKDGRIKSVSIRDRGKVRGTRLVSFESLSAFLEKNATGGEEQAAPRPTA